MGQNATRPSWHDLYEVASAQEGHFTTAQAAAAGYSSQLLAKHLTRSEMSAVDEHLARFEEAA